MTTTRLWRCAAVLLAAASLGGAVSVSPGGTRSGNALNTPSTPLPSKLGRALREGASTLLATTALALSVHAPAMAESTEGFAEYSSKGGVMKADPSCFFNQCKQQTQDCFTNPSCLKGITCLGNCRAEQLCATRCFSRFGSEKLNAWLSCTLEEKECVTTGAQQDTSSFYADAPPRVREFKPSDLEGKWYKVLGYSEKYDCYPCQVNEFSPSPDGLDNRILFRVQKPGGEGFWQNDFVEHMVDERGPQGKASFTVTGKMFGLTFHEQWYVLGSSPGYRLVAYKGDTQQGPYEGAFVYTKEADSLERDPKLRAEVDAAARRAGLDPSQFCNIDNRCPTTGGEAAGAGSAEASKEKLEWKDIFELTEWFRPGTLQKPENFDPNAM